jgi:hypothetical protein
MFTQVRQWHHLNQSHNKPNTLFSISTEVRLINVYLYYTHTLTLADPSGRAVKGVALGQNIKIIFTFIRVAQEASRLWCFRSVCCGALHQ